MVRPITTSGSTSVDAAMERYAAGDDAAFGDLYDALAPRLVGYLRRLVKSPSQVEDMVQATLLQMHRARGTFTRGAPVVPWAFAIARRLVIDEFRRHKREPPLPSSDEVLATLASGEASPLASLEAGQLAAVVEETLQAMSEAHRVAFRMLKVEGLSVAECAEVLGTSEATIKMRAHRAYEALRQAIDRRFGLRN
ncbi:MAG: RNA polymerase sigma factor [Deltaproteobacteria bacterium]|nr:RNA polymerase sigma factor [Deltaproteobacteria bacterium]